MTRFTEQPEGAKLHNAAQAEQRRQRDAELVRSFEASGLSMRAYAREQGISVQRLSVRLRRARES